MLRSLLITKLLPYQSSAMEPMPPRKPVVVLSFSRSCVPAQQDKRPPAVFGGRQCVEEVRHRGVLASANQKAMVAMPFQRFAARTICLT